MKTKNFTKTFTLLLGLMLIAAFGFAQATIVEWNFDDETKQVEPHLPYSADDGIPSNVDIAPVSLTGASFTDWNTGASGQSANANNWDDGNGTKYWQASFSTEGYENLALSSKQRGSNTGPGDFKVEYSLDDLTWADVPSANITVENNFTTGVLTNVALPAACNDQPTVYLRWIMTSNTSVNGGTVASAGTNRIDDIVITGTALPLTLTLDVEGEGTIGYNTDVNQPVNINQTRNGITWVNCIDPPCDYPFEPGTYVQIRAVPAPGWEFVEWVGTYTVASIPAFRIVFDQITVE